jgi:hypothetical protein
MIFLCADVFTDIPKLSENNNKLLTETSRFQNNMIIIHYIVVIFKTMDTENLF